MPLNVLRFEYEHIVRWGVVKNGQITVVPGEFATTAAFLRSHSVASLKDMNGERLREDEVTLLSPVTVNQQFVCQGANYRAHMIESGMDPDMKTYNMIFTKAPGCIAPANSDVIQPRHVRFLDYEIELGLVIGRDITAPTVVTDDTLHAFVAGLVIVNDYSARDIQIPQMQFYKGKSYRTFGPVGPYLCLLEKDDFENLRALRLRLTVNGKVRQADSTANLVYGPAETLTELSGVQNLGIGDLLATGTPAGCALTVPSPARQKIAALLPEKAKWKLFLKMQARRPQYLKPGDLVEAGIVSSDGSIDLGRQRNRIVGESP